MSRQVTNNMCAHQWAHQLKPEGKGSNFYFEGRVIYSYGRHFPIAYQSGGYVYFTRQSYSKTTSNHKRLTRSAISHMQILFVDHVPSSEREFQSIEWKERNVTGWLNKITELHTESVMYPRKTSLLRKLGEEIHYLTAFCQSLGMATDALLSNINGEWTSGKLSDISREWSAYKADLQEKRQRTQSATLQAELENWHQHKAVKLKELDWEVIGNLAFLRIARNGEQIETSKGVFVPFPVAHRFWQFIRRQLQTGDKLDGCKFMQYGVEEISQSRIIVGCHTIQMSEVDFIARKLGWE